MNLNETQCCAMQEIYGLIDYAGQDPKKAMLAFCKNLAYYGIRNAELQDPGGLILFTGVEKVRTATEADFDIDSDADYDEPVGYAKAFAEFIKVSKLGRVRTGPGAYNRKNHPTHYIVAYVWAPNFKALQAWYKENK